MTDSEEYLCEQVASKLYVDHAIDDGKDICFRLLENGTVDPSMSVNSVVAICVQHVEQE